MFTEKRPELTKDLMLEAASDSGNYGHDKANDIAEQYADHMDAFELAKDLELYCFWNITAADVADLDDLIDSAEQKLKEQEKEWAARNNIKQPLENGTRIKEGVIDGVYEYGAACYTVIKNGEDPTSSSRRIIKFEDAIVVDAEDKLWAVHIKGPDSIAPVMSIGFALQKVAELNKDFAKIIESLDSEYAPTLEAEAIEWTGTPEAHAELLAEGVDWSDLA